MNKNRLVFRFIILFIATIIFISMFYFFFKNSRASSPRNNKQYMEQLKAANSRYNTTGKDISKFEYNNSEQINNSQKPSLWEQILELFKQTSQ